MSDIITVTDLNLSIKKLIEENFPVIFVTGEISNFKEHSQSGHFYFVLKDDNSQINAVMWRSMTEKLLFTPEDGMQVIITGRLTVFQAKGAYQLEVWDIKLSGFGEMQMKIEKLKRKLYEEGLFDEANKKPLPKFPENVVLISSKTGAVIHDFIKVAKRRYPLIHIFIYPVRVQGREAPQEIIQAINHVQKINRQGLIKVDLIVIARGGGSAEDLLPFNDEKLARAIHACNIPVVSAVGHEVDYTICDLVADFRAPTPSAAAELTTPDKKELIETIDKISYYCGSFVQRKIENFRASLKEIYSNYYFNRPKDIINNYYQRVDEIYSKLDDLVYSTISQYSQKNEMILKTLHHISPEVNLRKGYSIVRKKADHSPDLLQIYTKIVSRAGELSKEDEIQITFFDNKRTAKVTD
jgi:exodeoxyribonuclease VII large subunit